MGAGQSFQWWADDESMLIELAYSAKLGKKGRWTQTGKLRRLAEITDIHYTKDKLNDLKEKIQSVA